MQLRPVYLVRHGETESNRERRYAGRSPEPLNRIGRRQLIALAETVSTLRLRTIRTSRVPRACQTATILGGLLDLPVSLDRRLDEMKMGPWKGMTEDEVERKFPEDYALWQTEPQRVRLEGRETLVEIAKRTMAAVRDAAKSGGDVLLITHTAPIRVAVLSTLGRPLAAYRRIAFQNITGVRLHLAAREAHRFPGGECLATELNELGIPAE